MENECVRFPEGLSKKLTDRAIKTGFRRADIVRAAVAAFLEANNTPAKTSVAILKYRTGGAK